jgi:hypothetical protein
MLQPRTFRGVNPGGCDGFRVGCSFQEVSTRRRPRWAIDALMDLGSLALTASTSWRICAMTSAAESASRSVTGWSARSSVVSRLTVSAPAEASATASSSVSWSRRDRSFSPPTNSSASVWRSWPRRIRKAVTSSSRSRRSSAASSLDHGGDTPPDFGRAFGRLVTADHSSADGR